jgi:hypothetical protein
MRCLRNLARTEDADAKLPGLFHVFSSWRIPISLSIS